MPQVRIVARNFMDMVASLPPMKLDKLYENSFICEAILRLYSYTLYRLNMFDFTLIKSSTMFLRSLRTRIVGAIQICVIDDHSEVDTNAFIGE